VSLPDADTDPVFGDFDLSADDVESTYLADSDC
jgi:hypothetical protein